MKVVVQRVLNASVEVNKQVVGKIDSGLLVFVGFTHNDNISNIKYIVNKIFDDSNGVMNLSAKELNKQILAVSQFTLYGDVSKGNRPSYINSLNYEEANKLYDLFVEELRNTSLKVETGIFRSDMKVNLINDGPITIIIEK